MSVSLNGIDIFVCAAEAGNFARAAEQLNLSRSAVAKTISKLEARLATRLFHRTTRNVALTDDGQLYYERCLRALNEMREAEAALESGRHEVAGRLRVSVPVQFGRLCVAPVLSSLAAQHPQLELELAFSDRRVDLVEEGFDLAVRNGEIGNGAGLITRTICLQRMMICASREYLARNGQPSSLEDLADHRAIVYGQSGRTTLWEFPSGEGRYIHAPVSCKLQMDDLEAIAEAAEAGHGIAWLPCWLVRERVSSGKLVPVLRDVPSLVFRTSILRPETPHLPLRTRMAIDALAASLPGSAEL
ncbi:LysR family transcriptional regulator [Hyphomonas sp. ND6WE1B]|uniref:LysR family transcriptional regulator n=1 Tax=Hyphomonas sp. ND6WE1B TaxID=1848191 RepID=UPI0008076ED6|nr:LysR family transcriptional regulator [Hyphomonas sp. ND6WE1B]